MARPIEYGLEYFPLDVDFLDDPKLIVIEEQFKSKGLIITVRILSMIYRNGYFLSWNNDTPVVIAKRVGCDVNGALVIEVVKALIRCEFFNENVFNKCQILTSAGIQKRWKQIIDDCKRKAVINPQYLINSELIPPVKELTTPIPEETPQRKRKERKGKENKEDDEEPPPFPPPQSLKNIKNLFDIFSERQDWLTECAKEFKQEHEGKILAWLVEFNRHLEKNSDLAKTEKDYATHFRNWLRKQPIVISNVAAGKKEQAKIPIPKFPDHFDQEYENKLKKHPDYPEVLSKYWQHLSSNNWHNPGGVWQKKQTA